MLFLRTAVAAARNRDRRSANDLLRKATDVAQQLGVDANYWQTSFGPTNVELHRLWAALDLGDVSYVVDHDTVDAATLPVERRVVHLIDMARALTYQGRHDDQAIDRLLDAEREAPTLVRQNTSARETIKMLLRRAPSYDQRANRHRTSHKQRRRRRGDPRASRRAVPIARLASRSYLDAYGCNVARRDR